jgi:hypothetical protein
MAYELVTDEEMQEILDAKSARKGGTQKQPETIELLDAFDKLTAGGVGFLQAIPDGKDARKYADSLKTRLTNNDRGNVFVKIDSRSTPPTHIFVRKTETKKK